MQLLPESEKRKAEKRPAIFLWNGRTQPDHSHSHSSGPLRVLSKSLKCCCGDINDAGDASHCTLPVPVSVSVSVLATCAVQFKHVSMTDASASRGE